MVRDTLLIIALVGLGLGGLVIWQRPWETMGCPDHADGVVRTETIRIRVAIANTPDTQIQGYIGCTRIDDGTGMYFPQLPARIPSFWMKNMQVPIDIIWISHGRIVGMEAQVPVLADDQEPRLYEPSQPVDGVLEVAAGYAERAGLEVGQKVILESV